jgi:hypothetical protein
MDPSVEFLITNGKLSVILFQPSKLEIRHCQQVKVFHFSPLLPAKLKPLIS